MVEATRRSPFNLTWIAVRLAVFLFGLVLAGYVAGTAFADTVLRSAGSFELIDHTGRRVNEQTFKGKPSLVFFGFTHCPDICPTTLDELSNQLRELGPLGDQINMIFVSVDPGRDTQPALRDYLSNFDSRIIGLTGKPEMVAGLAKALGATFKKVATQDGDYIMDHSIVHFMVDRQWRRVGILYARGGTDGSARTQLKLRDLIGK